jgi:A/G-specific adenine glycosylase
MILLSSRVTTLILDWYTSCHRSFPWRAISPEKANPYFVLVSEFMLQQTGTRVVIPYFQRFISRFPTLFDLANADFASILQEWQGLGYYRRASYLHQSAQQICQFYSGVIPHQFDELQKLPGIGLYMAAAIASIVYQEPILALDGNILRILSRLHGLSNDRSALQKQFKPHIQPLESDQAGEINQALMDLGATLCRPLNPTCSLCPLPSECQTFLKNPVLSQSDTVKPKAKKRIQYTLLLLKERDQRIYFVQQPPKGIWAHLWVFPMTDWSLSPPQIQEFQAQNPLTSPTGIQFKHIFSHFELRGEVVRVQDPKIPDSDGIWISQDQLSNYPMPSLMRKLMPRLYF